MMACMGKVVDLLNRPTYGLAQVDRRTRPRGGAGRPAPTTIETQLTRVDATQNYSL